MSLRRWISGFLSRNRKSQYIDFLRNPPATPDVNIPDLREAERKIRFSLDTISSCLDYAKSNESIKDVALVLSDKEWLNAFYNVSGPIQSPLIFCSMAEGVMNL